MRRRQITAGWFEKVKSTLPEPTKIDTLWTECDYYGASHIISGKLKLGHVPVSKARWAHGWEHLPCEHQERYNWGWNGQRFRNLVHREEEARFLRRCGFDDAMPVGAPFLYTDWINRRKIAGSLLIVPFHSLENLVRDYDEESYFLMLDPFLRKFDHVAACIHPSCAHKGFWLRSLQRRSIPWTHGAEVHDSNALRRMRGVFEQFSHVTSNSIGSHVPYAAFCNCSVSIYGPQPHFRPSDWRAHPYYKENPKILEWMVDLHNTQYVERTFAWLFREPTTDANDRDWALQQLGHSNMKTPIQLADLFGWNVPESTSNQSKGRRKVQRGPTTISSFS